MGECEGFGWWRNLYKIRLGEQAMGYRRRKIEEGKNPRVTDRRGRSTLNVFDIDKRPMQPAQSEQGWEDCCELRSTLVMEKLGGHGKRSRFCSK